MRADSDGNTLVTFWGTRGSISTPGRTTEKYGGNTPCVTVRHEESTVIFDAGTGIRNVGIELVEEMRGRGTSTPLHLFLSHTHWDHIQGLPFFQPAYLKDIHLTIYGSPNKERFLESILKDQMDSDYFPVQMSALRADIQIRDIPDEVIRIGPLSLDWQEQIYHPGGSVRYGIRVDGKKIVYATDVELDVPYGGLKNVYGGETGLDAYRDFIRDADLLIADGQYTEEEYPNKVGWGHSSLPVLFETAARSGVKRIAVFHHDPQHSDKFLDDLWIKFRTRYQDENHSMDIFWAREGMTLAV